MRFPQSLAQDFSLRPLQLAIISAVALLALLPTSLHATNPLRCWPTKLRFGKVGVGQTQSLLVTVTNNGQSSVAISAINVSDSQFSTPSVSVPLTLAVGQSVDVSVIFAPSATGSVDAKIAFVASVGTLNLQVWGTGVTTRVAASPPTVSFGQVAVGSSATSPVVVTNTGSSSVSVSGLQTTGSGFSASGPSFPLALAAGASITLNVSFTPQTASSTTGNILVSGPGLNIPLRARGTTTTGQLTLTPTSLNFGNIPVGSTSTLSTVLGTSGGSVTISSAASSNAQFVLSGVSFPLTIATGQSVPLNIAFTPQSSGSVSGTVSFASSTTTTSSSTTPTTTEALTGTGTTPYVVLSWNPSTSVLSGYNVYRCLLASCSYSKINSSLDATTTFTDTTVASGQSYYYVTTAVNSSGQESTYSNQVQVTIP